MLSKILQQLSLTEKLFVLNSNNMPEMKEYIFVNFEMKKIISMERSNNTAGRMFGIFLLCLIINTIINVTFDGVQSNLCPLSAEC